MYDFILDQAIRSVDAIKRQLRISDHTRSLINSSQLVCRNAAGSCFDLIPYYAKAPDPREWRVIDHCSAVTQIYACYERFVRALLSEYLKFLEGNFRYDELQVRIRNEHRKRIGQILLDLDKDRYKDLHLASVITELMDAVTGNRTYKLLPEALLYHEQNLRMTALADLCGRCGIDDVVAWITNHRTIKRFFSEEGRQSDTVESELELLIQYRNEAAHGIAAIDDVLGYNNLIEYVDFIKVLFDALIERVQSVVISKYIQNGKAKLAGEISERFKDNIVVAKVRSTEFKVGSAVYLHGRRYCFKANILSIRLNDVDHDALIVEEETEVGFRFDVEPLRRANLYTLTE